MFFCSTPCVSGNNRSYLRKLYSTEHFNWIRIRSFHILGIRFRMPMRIRAIFRIRIQPSHMHRICKPATHSRDTFHLTSCILRYSSGGAGVEERRAAEIGELAPTWPEFSGTVLFFRFGIACLPLCSSGLKFAL
jgi:hypothetical protein